MRPITLALATAGLLAAAAPASAADYTVTAGKLDWTIANAFTSFGDPARTWLGYVTFNQVGNLGSSNGTAAVTAPATLSGPNGAAAASVAPDSARGLDQLYTFSYPVAAAGGTYTDYGLDLTVKTPRGITETRIAFAEPARAPGGLRGATVELARRARSTS